MPEPETLEQMQVRLDALRARWREARAPDGAALDEIVALAAEVEARARAEKGAPGAGT